MADPRLAVTRVEPAQATQPVFYYDLGDPDCYLVGEHVTTLLGEAPEWEPVLAAELGVTAPAATPDRERIERAAQALGLMALRWPPALPPDTREAMLAATYAKKAGRAVAFSLAAFRQAFAGGRDLSDQSTVLLAGAASEIHPNALLKGIGLRSTAQALDAACARARAAGVITLPAIARDGHVLSGPELLAALAGAADAAR